MNIIIIKNTIDLTQWLIAFRTLGGMLRPRGIRCSQLEDISHAAASHAAASAALLIFCCCCRRSRRLTPPPLSSDAASSGKQGAAGPPWLTGGKWLRVSVCLCIRYRYCVDEIDQ